MRATFPILICAILLSVLTSPLDAQFHLFGPRKPKPTPQPVRKASEFISRQAPVKVNQSLVKQATPDNTRIVRRRLFDQRLIDLHWRLSANEFRCFANRLWRRFWLPRSEEMKLCIEWTGKNTQQNRA